MQLCIKHLLIGEVLFVFSLSGPVKCVQKKKKKTTGISIETVVIFQCWFVSHAGKAPKQKIQIQLVCALK